MLVRLLLILVAINNCAIGYETLIPEKCDRPDPIEHGSFRMRRIFVRFSCNRGYNLQGPTLILCQNGRFKGERPVCAKRGCDALPKKPEHGFVELERNIKAILTCEEEYIVAGNHFSYCNGLEWDRPIGTCRKRNETHSHSCDFETEDLCGWTTIQLFFSLQWKRVMATNIFASFRTGPRHDHTMKAKDNGHYMLVESMGATFLPQHLVSPIYKRDLSLKTACCFRFYYFMYGAGVGTLYAFVKPYTLSLEYMWGDREKYLKFHLSGNQNNNWNEHIFFIDEMEEDFNVVFTTSDTSNHLGDIAIDDVQLLTGNDCPSQYLSTTSVTIMEESEAAFFDSMSCVGHCGISTKMEVDRQDSKLYGNCNCYPACLDDESCCPDFTTVCGDLAFPESTIADDIFPLETTTSTTTAIISDTTNLTTSTLASMIWPKIISTQATLIRTPTTTTTQRVTTKTATKSSTRSKSTTTTPNTTVITKTSTKLISNSTISATPKLKNILASTTKTTTSATRATFYTTMSTYTSRTAKDTTESLTIEIPRKVFVLTTPKMTKKIKWKISEIDLQGSLMNETATSPRSMSQLLLVVILVIIIGTVAYRWKDYIVGLFSSYGSRRYENSVAARFTQRITTNTQSTISKFFKKSNHRSLSRNRDCMNEPFYDDDDDFDQLGSISLENKISEL